MNIVTAVTRAVRSRLDHVALRCDGVEMSYGELLDEAARLAGFLQERGLGAGDRVAVFLHNQLEYVPAMFGIWYAGGVVVPLNFLFTPSSVRHAVADSGASWLLCRPEDVARLSDALAGLDVELMTVTPTSETPHSLATAIESSPAPNVVPRMDHHDAVLMYTSGSTGTPKGVRQTHRNTVAACEATIDAWQMTPDDHFLVCTPLFHVGGLQLTTLPTLLIGGTVTLRRWSVEEYLRDAVELRPSLLALVPAMMIDIVNRGGAGVNLDSVRVCAIGGSALPQSRLTAFTDATGITPVNIYGQTEQSGLAVCEPTDRDRREGSLGLPLQQIVQHRLAPVDGPASVAEAEGLGDEVLREGELWVRGDAVTPGYWNLPEVNAEKFVDGWFRTGDIMRADKDGYLYYVERTDDMIISGGENVYPQMIEGHLQESDLVAEVAVIGTPDERLSQQVTAIVVPSRSGVEIADIEAFCRSHPDLRGLQRPRRIEIVEMIPRTATNKIDRPLLRKGFS